MDQPLPTPAIQETVKPKPGYGTRLFSGRLNRQNFLVGSTFFALIPLICFLVVIFNSALSASSLPSIDPITRQIQNETPPSLTTLFATPANAIALTVGTLFFLISIPYLLSLQIRRLHDLDKSGWYLLLSFVPVITYLFSFYISLWPGTNGENKYGPPPPARTNFMTDILQIR